MSDETHEALERALQVHLADETDGGYLTAWVLTAHAAVPADADASSYLHTSHGGAVHELLGLTALAHRRAKLYADSTFDFGDEDDEA